MDEASREEVERGISAAFANVADRLWSEVREAAACVEPDREAVYGKVRAAGAVAEIEDLYKFNNLTAEDIMGAVGNVSPEAYADPATYEPTIARLAAECSDGHLPEKDEVLASLNGMKRGLPLSPKRRRSRRPSNRAATSTTSRPVSSASFGTTWGRLRAPTCLSTTRG